MHSYDALQGNPNPPDYENLEDNVDVTFGKLCIGRI